MRRVLTVGVGVLLFVLGAAVGYGAAVLLDHEAEAPGSARRSTTGCRRVPLDRR